MPDVKISALPAAGTLTDADVVALVNGTVSTKATLAQMSAYFEQRSRAVNASIANQTGFAADTYLVGSEVTIPTSRLQARSTYRCTFNVVKTAAGTAAPILNVRIGTAATTADVSRGTHTYTAGTAVTDEGVFEFWATFRSVGAGTAAVLQSLSQLTHTRAAAGIAASAEENETATSAGFDSTVAGLKIGLSVNGGASAAWTVNLVQAELTNLA